MKTYILMFAFADYISGGPIYYRNKIQYLKENGWRVVVIPLNEGKVYIKGLVEYNHNSCAFLYDSPAEYTKKQRDKMLGILVSRVPDDSTDIIIETGSDHTAYWGELLAKKIGAKHFLLLLDEKNDRLKSTGMPFIDFKYNRGELACITSQTMLKLFDGYRKIDEDKAYSLLCWCSNSVADYDSEFTKKIKQSDYNIGYVGRLDKRFVPQIIDAVCEFADRVAPKQVSVVLFGGCADDSDKVISQRLAEHKNIQLYLSGYMWPIPLKAIRKCDMFISAAASAKTTAKSGVATLAIDVYSAKPIAIIDDYDKQYFTADEASDKSIADYIFEVLAENKKPQLRSYDYSKEWLKICNDFDKHMEFIHRSKNEPEWYGTQNMPLSSKQKVKKLLRAVLGIKAFNKLMK